MQATLTQRYTARALDFIERNKARPFFLYFAHAMPHKPLAASEDFYKKSGAGLYGDAVAELDWSVGQVLAKLKELGLDENTLVLFTSDNGALVRRQHGRTARHEGQHLRGRLPRAVHRALAGENSRRSRERATRGDDGSVRHRAESRERRARPTTA